MRLNFRKIGAKLLIVCLSFALPIAVMLELMVSAKQKDIDFAVWEKKGDFLQRPLEKLLEQASILRLLEIRRFNGDRAADHEITEAQERFSDRLKELKAAYQTVSEDLQFNDEGLGKRNRREFTFEGLSQKWSHLFAISGEDKKSVDEAYKGLIAHLRTMITHSGDTSNLILDPDLDSYYLMDVTLLALPQMEDRLQEAAAYVEHLYQKKDISRAERLQAGILAQFLKEADLDRIAGSIATSINEDQNFYGKSLTLQNRVPPAMRTLSAAIEPVIASVRKLSELEELESFDITGFRQEARNAIRAAYEFHHLAFEEEDRLLETRVTSFQADIRNAILLTTLALAISAALAYSITASIIRRVRHFNSVTKQIAQGDLTARVNMTNSDEIGELAQSFDTMTEKINRLNDQIAHKNKELVTINADLERLVAERTKNMKTMLDNLDQGFLVIDQEGMILPEVSRAATQFFGTDLANKNFIKCLPVDDDEKRSATSWLEIVYKGTLAFNSMAQLAPESFERAGRYIELSYRPIYSEGREKALEKIICIASDKTEERSLRQRAEAEATLVRVVMKVLSDRPAFVDFVFETRTLFGNLSFELAKRSPDLDEIFRLVHSLKGSLAVYCFDDLARVAHQIENQLADLRGQPAEKINSAALEVNKAIRQLNGQFELFLSTHESVLGPARESADRTKSLPVSTIYNICELLESEIGKESPLFQAYVDHFVQDDVSVLFQRYESVVSGVAERQMKSVEFKLNSNGVKVFTDPYLPLITSYVHVFRNSVDHGIEDSDLRLKAGKPETARVEVRLSPFTNKSGAELLRIEVSDDGKGIDPELVRKKALEKMVATRAEVDRMSDHEVLQLLFRNGFSTKTEISDISGRGVGLDAVKLEVEKLGGTIRIESEIGKGTKVVAEVPHFKSVTSVLKPQQKPGPRLAA